LKDLEKKLQLQGIEMQYKYKGQTSERQGVSFKIGANIFKGSKVDRQFSLGNLEKMLQKNQQHRLVTKQHTFQSLTSQLIKQAQENRKISEDRAKTFEDIPVNKGIQKVIDALVKPEENYQQPPYELLKENKPKRKKTIQKPAWTITSLRV
jgi:hypothetical protein